MVKKMMVRDRSVAAYFFVIRIISIMWVLNWKINFQSD